MKKRSVPTKPSYHSRASRVHRFRQFGSKNIIIVISSLSVAAVGLSLLAHKHTVFQAVEGASIFRPMFAQTTVQIPQIEGARSYNIYYWVATDTTFTHAARNIPATSTSFTVEYLRKGVNYVYKISAVNQRGAEFWFSESTPITQLSSM